MLHPFGEIPEEELAEQRQATFAADAGSALADADFSADITYSEIRDIRSFLQPIELVMRTHWSTADVIRDRFFSPTLPPHVKNAVEPHRDGLDKGLSELQKHYRVYVETSSDDSLEKEASRLERRYFESTQNRRQIQFLKLKRLYEKIRTFNSNARRDWREVQKVLDTFTVMKDTQQVALSVEKEFMRNLQALLRQTDHFLDELSQYIDIQEETVDPITGSHKIQLTFNESKRYTIAAMLGESDGSVAADVAPDPEPTVVDMEPLTPDRNKELEGSLATNIVLETREHKLNRASIISVPLLGSRDWNRSPDYNMEVPIKFFEECVMLLKDAYHVNVDENDILIMPMATPAAVVRKGSGEHHIVRFHNLINRLLAESATGILMEDFPGVEKPEVFLYHCGPNVFYRILLGQLKEERLGEMFYLDINNSSVREYPEEFIKKVLIDWWNKGSDDLDREDVDSYLTYSRQLEMVKREYRILYEEGTSLRKREQPGVGYLGVETWLKENKLRVFGLRKMEIFRRFIQGTVIE